jgi:hypothetical protein
VIFDPLILDKFFPEPRSNPISNSFSKTFLVKNTLNCLHLTHISLINNLNKYAKVISKYLLLLKPKGKTKQIFYLLFFVGPGSAMEKISFHDPE